MPLMRLQRAWRCARPSVFAAAIMLACVCAIRWTSGCERPEAVRPLRQLRQKPLIGDGAPTIRVLLTRGGTKALTVSTTGGYRLLADGKELDVSESSLRETIVKRDGSKWHLGGLTVEARQVVIETSRGGLVRLGAIGYRGSLHLLPGDDGKLIAVNHLDMESYLAGVLARELYPNWSPQAYRALAVAARTFAMYHMLTFGPKHSYDLGSTEASQVYGGATAETPKSWQAVETTRGQVLTFGRPGDERVFMAQYSSSCGGWTNAARVIRNAPDIEPLRGGRQCSYCKNSSRYQWDPVRIAKTDLHRALAKSYKAANDLPDVKELRVIEATETGRAVWVDVLATGGKSIRLRAEDIRLALLRTNIPAARKLYSMNCRFRDLGSQIEFYDGRGFGHGVGLCQWGAEGMAAAGRTGEQILDFYYPGSKRFRAY